MAGTTPHVEQETLTLGLPGEEQIITVGTLAWYTWLETATAFTFACPEGAFTARRERASSGRGGWYWRAEQRRGGVRRRAYLGKPEELTLEQLRETAASLASADAPAYVSARRPAEAPAPADFPPLRTTESAAPVERTPDISLLTTKLYVPRVRPTLLSRPRLLARLDAGIQRPLTLICAPAGFGKTTLVGDWIASLSSELRILSSDLSQTNQTQNSKLKTQDFKVAWLSLEADDNDLTRFLTYLITALQTHDPTIGQDTQPLLQSPQPPSTKAILAALINDLHRQPAPFVLVLDDYHTIEAEFIHEVMIFLADHLPPQMHLVIISRADPPLPLARLRARDHMIEVRAADLRFTPEEAAIFLNQTMGLSLSAEQVAALEARTEGWITGLQLAALSMQGQHDVASFIAAFTGSHRFVLDYLSDEVVRQQSEAVQQFLLRTCILERLCGPLCDAVMGIGDQGSSIRNAQPIPDPRSLIPDSYSQFTLEQLERANLFLVPLDNDRQWYRYHHLFADVLRKRLEQHQPDLVPQLHRRASVWYEQASLTTQAVQHALAAHAFSRAAALVEQVAPTMLQYSGLAQLLTWLGALPVDEVRARPLLGLYYTWGLFLSGQVRQAANRLEAIEAMLTTDSAKQAPEVYGHIAAMRAYLVRDTGDFAATIAFSRQALANLPEHDSRLWAGVAVNLALAHYLQGEFDLAEPLLSEIIATGQMAQRIANTLSAMYIKTQLLRAQGALHQARQLCRDGLEVVIRGGWHNYPEVGHLYLVLGDLARERNELSAAAEHLKKGIELGQEGHPHILIIGHVWLARLLQAEGDVTGSQEAIRVALRLVQQHQVSPFWPLPSAACYQARLWIVQGNLAAASHWGQASRLNQANAPGAYMYEIEYVTLARLLIAQGSLEGAEAMLLRLHHSADSAQRKGSLIEICILQAITYAAQQRAEAAFSALTQALGLAEPEGYVRIFVDEGAPVARLLQTAQARGIAPKYVETLLASFPEAQSIERTTQNNRTLALGATPERSNALVEPLTNRELQVLHLMAAGASNQTIADQLVITLHTAKKHVGIILGKLGVANRTEAVARARELSIL